MDFLKSSSIIAQKSHTNPKMILDTIPSKGSNNKYNNGIYINLGNKSLSKHKCDYDKHKHSQYSVDITFNGKSIFTGSLCPNDALNKANEHILSLASSKGIEWDGVSELNLS